MVGADRKAECPQHSLSANAKNDLLPDAVDLIPAIEPVRNGPVPRIVLRHVRVQEDDRDRMSERRFELVEPGSNPYRPTFDYHRDHYPDGLGVILRTPGIRTVDLCSLRIDVLMQISGSTCERDEDHWKPEIRCGPRRIACKDPKPARIRMHFRTEPDFHREIGNPSCPEVRCDIDHGQMVAACASSLLLGECESPDHRNDRDRGLFDT